MTKLKVLGNILMTAAFYYLVGRCGLYLASINGSTSPFWPAAGVAVALTRLLGRPALAGVFLGAMLLNVFNGSPAWVSAMIGFGTLSEAFVSKSLLEAFHKRVKYSGDANSKTALTVLALVLGAFTSALCGTTALSLAGIVDAREIFHNLLTWCVGDFIGAIVAYPLIVSFFEERRRSTFKDVVFSTILLAVCGSGFYWGMFSEYKYHFVFIVFPFLTAIALIADARIVTIATFVMSLLATAVTVQGVGPFYVGSLNDSILNLQLFVGSLAVSCLFLTQIKRNVHRSNYLVVLVLGWTICWQVAHYFDSSIRQRDQSKLNNLVFDLKAAIHSKIDNNVHILFAGKSFFATGTNITQSDWKKFISNLHLEEWNPYVTDLGVVFSVPGHNLDEFKSWYKKNHASELTISKNILGSNDTDLNWILTFISTTKYKATQVGMNLATESHRYEAFKKARDTNQLVISAPLYFQGTDKNHSGFLMIMPLDSSQGLPNSGVDFGWLTLPISWQDIFADLNTLTRNQIHFEVFDSATPLNEGSSLFISTVPAKKLDDQALESDFTIGGRTLKIRVTPSMLFLSERNETFAWSIAAGLIITLLLTGIVLNLQSLQQRAQAIADANSVTLRQREAELSNILNLVPVGIFKADFSGQSYFANSHLQKMMGLEESDASFHFFDGIRAEEREGVKAQTQATIKLNGRSIAECGYLTKDGSLRQIRVEVVTEDPTSDSGFFLGCAQDVTSLRQTERELERQRLAAAQVAKMSALGEMAGGIAHEINNPLAIIHGRAYRSLKLLESADFKKEIIVNDLEAIGDTATRIARIVKGLRAFSRNGNSDPFEMTTVRAIMEQALDLCRERFKNHEIKLIIGALPNWPIRCRPVQILQVLINLLNNSFDAIRDEEDKWIKIAFEHFDGRYDIIVSDCGHGIPEQVEKKIFDPFFTTKEVGQGTGLGLSISKGLIEDNKGTIHYELAESHTSFRISFPAEKMQSVA